ncbi:MAG: deaminase [Candidatus Moraniibacteriota bacterium]
MPPKKTIIAFVPVLHRGYRAFFERHADAESICLLGPEWTEDFPWLAKEIRALDAVEVKTALEAWQLGPRVRIVSKEDLARIETDLVVVPDEDIMREIAALYLETKQVVFDTVFLRWDKHNTVAERPVSPDIAISADVFDQEMLAAAEQEAKRGSDFWRHVGAAIVKDGRLIISAHNAHVPSEQMPYVNGDPRNNFHKGVHLELSTALHAEAGVIAEAAREGVTLEGTSLYVTTFPCPPCAKLVAYSGIKKIYYRTGYGVLDGEDILKSRGVQIIFVEEK